MLNHHPGPTIAVLTLLTDREGRYLLTSDADDPKADWTLPGDTLQPGETPTVAAHRALREHLGLGLTFAETDLLAHEWRVQELRAELVYLFTAPPLTAIDAVNSVLKPRADTAYCWAEHERALDMLANGDAALLLEARMGATHPLYRERPRPAE